MKTYISTLIQNTPRLLLFVYGIVFIVILSLTIEAGKQFWLSRYSTQSLYGCINRVALKESKDDVHNIYVVDKFNNEIKLSVEGRTNALELKAHQFYCYDFDIYLFSPLVMGNTQKFIARINLPTKEEAPTKLRLADYINRQLEKHAPAAGRG